MIRLPASLRRSIPLFALVVVACGLLVYAQAPQGQPERPNPKDKTAQPGDTQDLRAAYERAHKMNALAKGHVFKATVAPQWFRDKAGFWYRNDLRGGGKEFLIVDAERGTRTPAFDHKRMAEALTKATGTTYQADKLPFDVLKFVDEYKAVEVTAAGYQWKCDLTSYELTKGKKSDGRDPPPQPPEKKDGVEGPFDDDEAGLQQMLDELETPLGLAVADTPLAQQKGKGDQKKDGPPQAPREVKSPDGKWTARAKDFNVFIEFNANGTVSQLAKDGVEGNAYGNFSWAPDSKSFAAVKSTTVEAGKAYMLDSTPKGQLRSKVTEWGYRLPGDKVETRELHVFHPADAEAITVDTEAIDFGGPLQLHWKKDGKSFCFLRTYRGHTRCRLVEVDVATGKARDLIDEKCDTRIVRAKQFLQYLDETNEILWASERDGWNHLYLIDATKGEMKQQITQGPWVLRKVERVDEKERQVWFSASGRNLDQDPYFVHYYRVNFDGSGLVALTEGNGNHSITYSPDRKYLIDTYARVDLPPVTQLRRVSDGSLVCDLEKADVSALTETGWRVPEPFFAKGRDGKTDIWGVVYLPSDFSASKKYPVIEYIYAGPWTSTAPKLFAATSARQQLAELGFVVVVIDGMGTPNRSRAFHDMSVKNNGDCGLPDRILWIRALAKKYPNLDLGRGVGIYGHSGGGYSSLRALLTHGDFYKVAVSSSGNHDPRTYNLPYTEQWMGWPLGDYYADQSNVTHAGKLQGKLLLIHGEIDNNVVGSMTTMRVADSLIKANKDFDLLILPGKSHAVQGPYVTRRTWDFFVRHLMHADPPPAQLFPQKGVGEKGEPGGLPVP
jgi:dipeptidyl aminopeptidase/acylaminoacyl peptidase